MGSNDHIPVPDPKPKRLPWDKRGVIAEFKVGLWAGVECEACGRNTFAVRVLLCVGESVVCGYRCLPCLRALRLRLLQAWEAGPIVELQEPHGCNLNGQTSPASQART